jgi:hypothetical protein
MHKFRSVLRSRVVTGRTTGELSLVGSIYRGGAAVTSLAFARGAKKPERTECLPNCVILTDGVGKSFCFRSDGAPALRSSHAKA